MLKRVNSNFENVKNISNIPNKIFKQLYFGVRTLVALKDISVGLIFRQSNFNNFFEKTRRGILFLEKLRGWRSRYPRKFIKK